MNSLAKATNAMKAYELAVHNVNGVAVFSPDHIRWYIHQATNEEFTTTFPYYQGLRRNFNYAKYQQNVFEKRLNLHCTGSQYYTARDCRRAYKIALSRQTIEPKDKALVDELPLAQSQTAELVTAMQTACQSGIEAEQRGECLRCLLIKQGTILIPSFAIHACEISNLPDTKESFELDDSLSVVTDKNYQHTIAISVAMGAIDNRSAIVQDIPFHQRVFLDVHDARFYKYVDPKHKCIATLSCMIGSKTVTFRGKDKGADAACFALIFAPPGFGKTTFQHNMLKRGIFVFDTDDIPGLNADEVKYLLTRSSVITNQIGLVRAVTNVKVLIFSTTTPEILMNRSMMPMDISFANKWWDNISTIARAHPNATKCISDTKYLTDWFM